MQHVQGGGVFDTAGPNGQAQTSIIMLRGQVTTLGVATTIHIDNSSETLFINPDRAVVAKATWILRHDSSNTVEGGERIGVFSRNGTAAATIATQDDSINPGGNHAGTVAAQFAAGSIAGEIDFQITITGSNPDVTVAVRVEWTEVWDDGSI
jgi:hypothetical protein